MTYTYLKKSYTLETIKFDNRTSKRNAAVKLRSSLRMYRASFICSLRMVGTLKYKTVVENRKLRFHDRSRLDIDLQHSFIHRFLFCIFYLEVVNNVHYLLQQCSAEHELCIFLSFFSVQTCIIIMFIYLIIVTFIKYFFVFFFLFYSYGLFVCLKVHLEGLRGRGVLPRGHMSLEEH